MRRPTSLLHLPIRHLLLQFDRNDNHQASSRAQGMEKLIATKSISMSLASTVRTIPCPPSTLLILGFTDSVVGSSPLNYKCSIIFLLSNRIC